MNQNNTGNNPLLEDFDTPFEVPPFEKIQEHHFIPALEEGMKRQKDMIRVIIENPQKPTFENTLVALDNSSILLDRIQSIFDNLLSANTNKEMQDIAKAMAPVLSKHQDDIRLNYALFQRIKTVYKQKDKLNLTPEQHMLLQKTYKDFVRGGANLNSGEQEKLRKINEKLSVLTLKFGDNVLAETNDYMLIIEDEKELKGLPESAIKAAAETATQKGQDGKWVFTLHKPSLIPFLQYADDRNLREKIYMAYINRGNNGNEHDNKNIISDMIQLRLERANLLGYDTHAAYVLEKNMAETPENVYKILNNLWDAALPVAKNERKEMQKIIDRQGGNFKLASWDWWYYAEKLRKEQYDFDENSVRPYFQLQNVLNGVFDVANRLYGLQFSERSDLPKYHDDVRIFEVKQGDKEHIGILYMDFFPRESKRGGAWMSSFRKQSQRGGVFIKPVTTIVCNFSKPTDNKPALLSHDEVLTLFHEFGHALHGLLSECTYNKLSGTSVPRDFVELPSQIMENWASEPEVLKLFARHYETGETIPDELLEKLENSKHFNQGFATVEYLAASFLDMDWHTIKNADSLSITEFENNSLNKIGLIPEIISRYRSTYFQHIFSSGYSAGYYSYVWAEVLDADAFEAFREKGLFDQQTASGFREHILKNGGTEEPMTMYKKFRGKEPSIEPLLRRKGLKI